MLLKNDNPRNCVEPRPPKKAPEGLTTSDGVIFDILIGFNLNPVAASVLALAKSDAISQCQKCLARGINL